MAVTRRIEPESRAGAATERGGEETQRIGRERAKEEVGAKGETESG